MILWRDMTAEDRKETTRIQRKLARLERQAEMNAFAVKHELVCFKCESGFNNWGKVGMTNGRPWAICFPCQRQSWSRSRAAGVPPTNTRKARK